jgi:hypothetical protein
MASIPTVMTYIRICCTRDSADAFAFMCTRRHSNSDGTGRWVSVAAANRVPADDRVRLLSGGLLDIQEQSCCFFNQEQSCCYRDRRAVAYFTDELLFQYAGESGVL